MRAWVWVALVAVGGCSAGPRTIPQLGMSFADLGLGPEPAFVCGGDLPDGTLQLQERWTHLQLWYVGELEVLSTPTSEYPGPDRHLYFAENPDGCRFYFGRALGINEFAEPETIETPFTNAALITLLRDLSPEASNFYREAFESLIADCPAGTTLDELAEYEITPIGHLIVKSPPEQLGDCIVDLVAAIEDAGPLVRSSVYGTIEQGGSLFGQVFLLTDGFGVQEIDE